MLTSSELADAVYQLELTEDWLNLGLVRQNNLQEVAQRFLQGQAEPPAHHRYRLFQRFLQHNPVLANDYFEALFQLAQQDPHAGLRQAMYRDLLQRPDCPALLHQQMLNKLQEGPDPLTV